MAEASTQILAELLALRKTMRQLVAAVGVLSDKPVLNDSEAAAMLGAFGSNPDKYMEGLRSRIGMPSIKVGKFRRWRRTDLLKYLETLPEYSKEEESRKRRKRKEAANGAS